MMIWVLALIIINLICSVLTYGYIFNYYQKEFPEDLGGLGFRANRSHALLMSIIGFAGILVVLVNKRYIHGWAIR